jgi:hypothetical protein
MTIAQALRRVRERIAEAEQRAGRAPGSVRLVAVSKSKPAEAVREAYEAGQRDFGENYVQELLAKAAQLSELPGLCWHMIGHLQTNKVKQVVQVAGVVHTVDSERLAMELGRRVKAAGVELPVLLEVNVGGEQQKSGVRPEQAAELMGVLQQQEGLQLRGLMTVPPFELQARETARYFERLRLLRQELGGEGALPELSMGMSGDFEVAVEHGATMVRVGSMIFGER